MNKNKLKSIFEKYASPEEKLALELKESKKIVEKLDVEVKKVPEKTELTGEEIVTKVNELEIIPDKQIDFTHIKNFPWHEVKRMGGENGLTAWGNALLTVEEADGSPSVSSVTGIIFSNGSVTDNGDGTVTVSSGGSETLAQTLALGNTTGGTDIEMSANDYIISPNAQTQVEISDSGFIVTTDATGFLTPYFSLTPTQIELAGLGSGGIIFSSGSIAISHGTLINFSSGTVRFSALTASTVPYLDASKNLVSSSVTPTELGYVSGVTSAIQTQLNAKQASDAGLTDIAGLAVTDGNIIVGDGANWVAESGATARTSLGLGTIAIQASNSVSITGGSITGITDITVADGGTGASTLTGLLQGNGTSAFTAITNSSTVGQVLRVTGTSTYAWGALDLADGDAITGTLGVSSGGTGITSFGAGVATWLGTPSAANLRTATSGTTGSGNLVFATSPAFTTPALGTPSSGVGTNITGLVPGNLVAGTLAARINLGEGADTATIGLEMDHTLSADERYSGITTPGTAGATLAFGDLCYLDVTAGEWLLADADAAATSGDVPLGICVDAATDGTATSLLLIGTIRSAAFPASIALGAPVYVGTTAGDIQATQPSGTDDVIRRVGFAITVEPNTFFFNPSSDYTTHT